MNTFIDNVLQTLKKNNTQFSEVLFVLPSKRAGVFLKNKLSTYQNKTDFAPQILSIEEFIENISGLKQLSSIELLFEFYNIYKKITPSNEQEPYDRFSKWAQVLIQDFNEIDRYLIEPEKVFEYLSAIQELNHWSLEEQKTELITNYLLFWKKINTYYYKLIQHLAKENKGYQGLIYKEASKNIDSYTNSTTRNHIFLGFNALNTSEEKIIKHLLNNNKADIYWDIDYSFTVHKNHSAGYFMKLHQKWPYYNKRKFTWETDIFNIKKNITIIGCSKSVGQSKYVGNLLDKLSKQDKQLSKTALVLGEEELLIPILNAIPKSIGSVNVTMGLPLKSVPLASLFNKLFSIHKQKTKQYYYKDIIAVITNPILQKSLVNGYQLVSAIQQNNIIHLNSQEILELSDKKDKYFLSLLFKDWNSDLKLDIEKCKNLIKTIKTDLDDTNINRQLEVEYLYRFYNLFEEIAVLNQNYNYITDLHTLHNVYKELLSSETLDFQGEPLEGLQIMGMLESRVLDFETVIITSVNEGILPGGKTNNSFIPYDVKTENNLPTYKEKDAVYTYHFYSLIHRAKNVYLIYDTEIDALKGGEKSRFITQLEVEGQHNITHKIIAAKIPWTENTLTTIQKDNSILEKLKKVASVGFSPSSLTNYVRNPADFYFEKILGIKNKEEVEETVAANTLGTVVHNTLEEFYKPLEGKEIKLRDLEKMIASIDEKIKFQFNIIYKKGNISTGKNLIAAEIAKRYVLNFLNAEIKLIKEGNTLKIIAIEVDNSIEIIIPELQFPIKIRGKVDRVDQLNGITRVIDYKTGNVSQNMVEVVDWNSINTDYKKYSKSFQVLCYAYMLKQQNIIKTPLEAGIISFKNLKSGLIKFATKPTQTSRTKDHLITDEILYNFEVQLKTLILEIFNPEIDFIEKELD